MPIIKDSMERGRRAQEKKDTLLRFLRDEIFTSPSVVADLLGVKERATRQTISSMERAGLVRRHSVRLMQYLPPVVVVGITQHGQGMAFDPDSGETPVSRFFEPAKHSFLQLQHTIDLQRLRITAENSGLVGEWMPGAALGARQRGGKNPDAILITASAGVRIAIEVERTLKNQKRYRAILRDHLQAIEGRRWDAVVWVSPTKSVSNRVRVLFGDKNTDRENGIVDQLADRHLDKLFFTDYEGFVGSLKSIESSFLPSL